MLVLYCFALVKEVSPRQFHEGLLLLRGLNSQWRSLPEKVMDLFRVCDFQHAAIYRGKCRAKPKKCLGYGANGIGP